MDGLLAVVAAVSFITSVAGVSLAGRWAVRWQVMDVPNQRSSHVAPTPLCGGVALVLINLGVWLWYGSLGRELSSGEAMALCGGAIMLAAVSLLDDLGHVAHPLRLAVHLCAAVIVVETLGSWEHVMVPGIGTVVLGPLGLPLTCLWIVGLLNAINFMDGLDGMAAGQTTVAAAGWLVLGVATGHQVLAVLGAALAASSLGFLVHNWHPAWIFMGDVGATFLGYALAALTVSGAAMAPRLTGAGILLVWPALFDSAFTVLARARRGENVFTGHQTFLFHRLVRAGWNHGEVASLYLVLSLSGAMLAVGWDRATVSIMAGITVLLLCAALWLLVRHQEGTIGRTVQRRGITHSAPPVDQTPEADTHPRDRLATADAS